MITPRSALSLAAAAVVGASDVSRCTATSHAQEDATPFGALSCSSNFGNPPELDKKLFSLAAATPAEIISLQKSKPALSVGPSAGGKFSYDRVDVYLAEKDLGAEDPEESAVASLYACVRCEIKKESWFTVAHERTDVPENPISSCAPGRYRSRGRN